MRKCKLGVLVIVMCMLVSGITAFAETKTFTFVVKPREYDANEWTAIKADDEQTAYITTTFTSGSGRIWAAVYDEYGGTQYTCDVAINAGDRTRQTSAYYIEGTAGTTYRLLGGDSEWEVTSDSFTASGRWTP